MFSAPDSRAEVKQPQNNVKPRLHFHSDCEYFAGCEHMLRCFFSDAGLRDQYDISFSYQYSPAYEAAFLSTTPVRPAKLYPLCMPDFRVQVKSIRWRPARILALAAGYTLVIRQWYILRNTLVLYRLWRRLGIDILHINNGGYPAADSCTSAVFAARLAGIGTIVYVVNNMAVPYKSFQRWPDYPFDRLVLRYVSQFVTGSLRAAQVLREALGMRADKVISIPNGVARPQLSADPVLTRKGLNGEGRVLILVAAVLEARKGHRFLFRALDALRRRSVPLPLVIVVGSGPLEASLRRFVDRAGLREIVSFVGRKERQDYLEILDAVDVLVLPSLRDEDFPNVVIEAMSLGKPVVATRVAGIPEQVEDGRTGFLVEPGDFIALADALQRLAADPSLRRSLGQAGFDRYRLQFQSSIAVGRYRLLYRALTSSML
jgi:glycosyltransferase involved in cell wall biosynthesis